MMFIKIIKIFHAILVKFDPVVLDEEEVEITDLPPEVKDISEPVVSIVKAIESDFLRFTRSVKDGTVTLTDKELNFILMWERLSYGNTSIGGSYNMMSISRIWVILDNDNSSWLTEDEILLIEETYKLAEKVFLKEKNAKLRNLANKLYSNTKIWEFE
jgi:hypothetical protein